MLSLVSHSIYCSPAITGHVTPFFVDESVGTEMSTIVSHTKRSCYIIIRRWTSKRWNSKPGSHTIDCSPAIIGDVPSSFAAKLVSADMLSLVSHSIYCSPAIRGHVTPFFVNESVGTEMSTIVSHTIDCSFAIRVHVISSFVAESGTTEMLSLVSHSIYCSPDIRGMLHHPSPLNQ